MSKGNNNEKIQMPENLGGMGDTDELVVVGMAEPGDEGGIGVIGADSSMVASPKRDAGRPGDGRQKPSEKDAGQTKRKTISGNVSSDVTIGMSSPGMAPNADGTKARHRRRGTRRESEGAKGGHSSIIPKILMCLLVVVLGLVVGVWAYGRSHYSEHLFPGRTVDGVNVSNMTASEAEEATSVANWSFVIDDRGERYELGSADVKFETEEVDFAKIISEQDVNAWFLHVIAPEKNESIRKSTYDSNAVHESIQRLPCVSGEREAPVDAKAERAEDGLSYHIVPEVEGNTVKADVIEGAVEKALAEGKNGELNLEEADAYVHPLVYANDESLVSAVDTANTWLKTEITYDIDGLDSVETLTPETISQWVDVIREEPQQEDDGDEGDSAEGEEQDGAEEETNGQDNGETTDGTRSKVASGILEFGRDTVGSEGGFLQVSATTLDDGLRPDVANDSRPKPTFKATFNDDGLWGWLAGIGDEYDTAGKPKTITTPNGAVKEVSGGGSYGWITDEAAEFEAIKASLDKGEQTHREFAMRQRAALPKGQNEWGDTYIEIDLSEQHLWYIRGGDVVLSYGVITGKSGYETPAMVSQVYSKVTDTVLISPWKDPKTGEPTYKTHIDVGLVISSDGGILCHDAPWQPSSGFGSPGYHWSGGSHGCCNMKTNQCWELYNTASVGDPVIIHY